MKKIVALALALVLLAALCLGGCAKKPAEQPAETKAPETEKAADTTAAPETDAPATEGGDTEPAPADTGDAYYCELILPVMQPIPAQEEIQKVEDAINDHILNDLGVTDVKMHLTFASLSDLAFITSITDSA